MSLAEIWKYLLESVETEPEYREVEASEGRLTIEEVRQRAVEVRDAEQWPLEPSKIALLREQKTDKLVWGVDYFLPGMEDEFYIGTQAVAIIDDETGDLLHKGYAPR